MNKTEMTLLMTDMIIAALVVHLTKFEAKGIIFFLCTFGEIIFTVFILLTFQLKFIGEMED